MTFFTDLLGHKTTKNDVFVPSGYYVSGSGLLLPKA